MNETPIKIGEAWYIQVDPPIAPGHNPDNLTVCQVGEGWKLIDSIDEKPDKRAQVWLPSLRAWRMRILVENKYEHESTYRIPITPPARVPLTAEDFPPGTAIRNTDCDSTYRLVLSTGVDEIRTVHGSESYNFLMRKCVRLLPGTTEWLPCYNEK